MKRLVALVLIVAIALMTVPAALADEIWYVYTENRGTLNVRNLPNGQVIGTLNYGEAVDVKYYSATGWSTIYYQVGGLTGEAYVMSRYLVRTRPGGSSGGSGGQVDPPGSSDALEKMNSEFRSARKVSPYTVIARPARASGWVNLRWAPSTDAERITTCTQGKELTVIAELTNWFQVQDPVTGMVGYISRTYVSYK